jgi:hypothetical protein
MARWRQAKQIEIGEYNGSATWRTGSGIEERERAAEDIGIKVTDKWVYLYLRDGEEIVRLSRTSNQSAQIYPNMSLRDVMRERVTNSVENSSQCCWGKFGWERHCGGEDSLYSERTPCSRHTAEWLEDEITNRLDAIITDEEWPSVLEARKIEAWKAQEYLEQKAYERQLAQECGEGEWRRASGCWKVWTLREPKRGDTVIVRTKYGATTNVIVDSSYETGSGWLSETHPAPVSASPAPILVVQQTA